MRHLRSNFILAALLLTFPGMTGCGSCSGEPAAGKTPQRNEAAAPQEPQPEIRLSPAPGTKFRQGETITVTWQSDLQADSVRLSVGDRTTGGLPGEGKWDYRTDATTPAGTIRYKATLYKGGKSYAKSGSFVLLPVQAPQSYRARVVKTYPHRTDAYTQGLEFHEGDLLESSGEYGKSYIQRRKFPSGEATATLPLDERLFAEGLTVLNGKLYLLTWQENECLVFDAGTLKQTGSFAYNGEGWGLTNDGKTLYMSDGSQYIYLRDPETFRETGRIEVMTDRGPVSMINELEWIDGEIWANVYTYDVILRIDPRTGAVKGTIDASGLLSAEEITDQTDVLNGIAQNPADKKIYVTGKNWNKLFEIKIVEP